nr:MAG TPA: hypothetical protein [Bacteriophage sp.]
MCLGFFKYRLNSQFYAVFGTFLVLLLKRV